MIVLLPGDGVGPEVVEQARKVLDAALPGLSYREELVGGAAIDATGSALPERTLLACREADAILLGAVGGPKWDNPHAAVRPEQGLLGLRKHLELFANLRPVRALASLEAASPLRPERVRGVDLIIFRELTGGLYFGEPRRRESFDGGVRAIDTLVYTDVEIRRIAELAFQAARGRRRLVTSVDKANVLESSRLWRQVVEEVARGYPDVRLEHQLVDSCAMRLVTAAAAFDVIVTENLFGDILSDEAAVLTGSLGMLPSASLGARGPGLYEPVHGSAPDIAGQGRANPIGAILSAAMLLRHSLGRETEARAIERAVESALDDGVRSADLGGTASTAQVGAAVLARLS